MFKLFYLFNAEGASFLLTNFATIDVNALLDKSVALFIAVLVIMGLGVLYRNSLKRVDTLTDTHAEHIQAINKQHEDQTATLRANQFDLALGFQKSISEQQQVLRDLERLMRETELRAADRDGKIVRTLEKVAERLTK